MGQPRHWGKYKNKLDGDLQELKGKRGERFPGIDWYCDRCNAQLNIQPGFDDHKYVWKCTKCGYKNSISRDNIDCTRDPMNKDFTIILGHILTLLRCINVYILISLALNAFGVQFPRIFNGVEFFDRLRAIMLSQDVWKYLISLAVLYALSMVFERYIAKFYPDKNLWILRSIGFYLITDISRPFSEIFAAIKSVIVRIIHPIKYGFWSNILYHLPFVIIYSLVLLVFYSINSYVLQ